MLSEGSHIIDTVVLMYFLLVGREALLADLLGRPLQVPLAVYDPEDRRPPEGTSPKSELLSEMRQAIRHYEAAAEAAAESESSDNEFEPFDRIKRIDDLYDNGSLVTVAMTSEELLLAAQLQSSDAPAHGLNVGLGPGEAACVAISHTRGWTIATDDADAFKVLDRLNADHDYPYERIRKLLVRAADEGRVSREEANRLHDEMRALGFWDSGQPFS